MIEVKHDAESLTMDKHTRESQKKHRFRGGKSTSAHWMIIWLCSMLCHNNDLLCKAQNQPWYLITSIIKMSNNGNFKIKMTKLKECTKTIVCNLKTHSVARNALQHALHMKFSHPIDSLLFFFPSNMRHKCGYIHWSYQDIYINGLITGQTPIHQFHLQHQLWICYLNHTIHPKHLCWSTAM